MNEGSWVGLDVHARSLVAGVIDRESGEVRSLRLPPGCGETVLHVFPFRRASVPLRCRISPKPVVRGTTPHQLEPVKPMPRHDARVGQCSGMMHL